LIKFNEKNYVKLSDDRVNNPAKLQKILKARKPRAKLTKDGKLFIVAADHTARGIISASGNPLAMADRYDLLDRLIRALAVPGVDGILATPDLVEELAYFGALDNKLIFGSINRAGILGADWELDDRQSAYDVAGIKEFGLDGGKTLLRIEKSDPGVVRTIEMVASVNSALARAKKLSIIEPLPYIRNAQGKFELQNDIQELVRVIGIASALGTTSAYTWLKAPAFEDFKYAARATSLPLMLLGGDPGNDWQATFNMWKQVFKFENVRALIPGRTILFSPELSVEQAVSKAVSIVRQV
jgi:DhnA family fructose-bisphosphate aldolase class Ia